MEKEFGETLFSWLIIPKNVVDRYEAWSIGGGSLIDSHNLNKTEENYDIYQLSKFAQLRQWSETNGWLFIGYLSFKST